MRTDGPDNVCPAGNELLLTRPGPHAVHPDGPDRFRHQRQVDVDRADRRLIAEAAARPRHDAIIAASRGATAEHYAFAIALLFDELGRHVRGLHADLRQQTVLTTTRALLDDAPPADAPDAVVDATPDVAGCLGSSSADAGSGPGSPAERAWGVRIRVPSRRRQ